MKLIIKLLVAAIVAVPLIVWGVWLIGVPEDALTGAAARALGQSGMGIEFSEFRKGAFFNFTSRAVDLTMLAGGRHVAGIEGVEGALSFMSLFKGSPEVIFKGLMGGGEVHGTVALLRTANPRMKAHIEGASVEALEYLNFSRPEQAGMKPQAGKLTGDLTFGDSGAELRFTIVDAALNPITVGGVKVPLDRFNFIRGALGGHGTTLDVTSLTLEGKGIYASIKGTIRGGVADLMLRLMIDKGTAVSAIGATGAIVDDRLLTGLLEAFKSPQGTYDIPLRGPVRVGSQ